MWTLTQDAVKMKGEKLQERELLAVEPAGVPYHGRCAACLGVGGGASLILIRGCSRQRGGWEPPESCLWGSVSAFSPKGC